MKHPCLGCANNWSGDIAIGCSDLCFELEQWKQANKAKKSGGRSTKLAAATSLSSQTSVGS